MVLLTTAALPFLLVWAAFILTGFSFNPREMFQSGPFWGVSVIYWMLWVCLLGLIVEMVDQAFTTTNKDKSLKTINCPSCNSRITQA